MLDLAKINGSDAVVGLIEENLNAAPEAARFPARTISGTSYKTLIRSALPTTQFRKVNEGVTPTKSTYENKLVECYYLDSQMEMDRAVASADEERERALALEADGHMQSALQLVGKQIWYGTGTGGDSLGFPGAVQIVDSDLVVDATGSTASTGSSVYGVKFGDKYVSLVFGKDQVFTMDEWRLQTITRSAKEMTAWKNSLEGWIGVQWVNKNAVGRIKKLTADSGKGLTDALIANLLSKFPVGIQPDAWFMSRRSAYQLQSSRTVVINSGPGGAKAGPGLELVAPWPTEAFGIPIIITDSILNTEALTL